MSTAEEQHDQEIASNGHAENQEGSDVDEEIMAAEKVINAFRYYGTYGRNRIMAMTKHFRSISKRHQDMVAKNLSAHLNKTAECIARNERLLRQMSDYGAGAFGDELLRALRITQLRRPSADYESKVLSTLRQIVREWSEEGKEDRNATFLPVIESLREKFPDKRNRAGVQILVPGCGLGRLPWDLIQEGFSVTGNEYSLFMLMISCYILNAGVTANQHTIFPFVFDKSNSWSYDDQVRGISFPDVSPNSCEEDRLNSFGMCAGNFLEITKDDDGKWDCLVTAWFIDTANNILDYIENIYRILKTGGVWVNVGPLTYHFEDIPGELSIEMPFSEVRRLICETGFAIETERKIASKYTINVRSMLHSEYTCAFFVAHKPN